MQVLSLRAVGLLCLTFAITGFSSELKYGGIKLTRPARSLQDPERIYYLNQLNSATNSETYISILEAITASKAYNLEECNGKDELLEEALAKFATRFGHGSCTCIIKELLRRLVEMRQPSVGCGVMTDCGTREEYGSITSMSSSELIQWIRTRMSVTPELLYHLQSFPREKLLVIIATLQRQPTMSLVEIFSQLGTTYPDISTMTRSQLIQLIVTRTNATPGLQYLLQRFPRSTLMVIIRFLQRQPSMSLERILHQLQLIYVKDRQYYSTEVQQDEINSGSGFSLLNFDRMSQQELLLWFRNNKEITTNMYWKLSKIPRDKLLMLVKTVQKYPTASLMAILSQPIFSQFYSTQFYTTQPNSEVDINFTGNQPGCVHQGSSLDRQYHSTEVQQDEIKTGSSSQSQHQDNQPGCVHQGSSLDRQYHSTEVQQDEIKTGSSSQSQHQDSEVQINQGNQGIVKQESSIEISTQEELISWLRKNPEVVKNSPANSLMAILNQPIFSKFISEETSKTCAKSDISKKLRILLNRSEHRQTYLKILQRSQNMKEALIEFVEYLIASGTISSEIEIFFKNIVKVLATIEVTEVTELTEATTQKVVNVRLAGLFRLLPTQSNQFGIININIIKSYLEGSEVLTLVPVTSFPEDDNRLLVQVLIAISSGSSVKAELRTAAAYFLKITVFNFETLIPILPSPTTDTGIEYLKQLTTFFSGYEIYFHLSKILVKDLSNSQLTMKITLERIIQLNSLSVTIRTAARYFLSRPPFFDYSSVISIIPKPTQENEVKLYTILTTFIKSEEVYSLFPNFFPYDYIKDYNTLLLELFKEIIKSTTVAENVQIAVKHYLSHFQSVNIEVQKVVSKSLDLTAIFGDTFDLSKFTKEQYNAYEEVLKYVSETAKEMISGFDNWTRHTTKGEFTQRFFEFVLEKDQIPAEISGAIKLLQPIIIFDGSGALKI